MGPWGQEPSVSVGVKPHLSSRPGKKVNKQEGDAFSWKIELAASGAHPLDNYAMFCFNFESERLVCTCTHINDNNSNNNNKWKY